MSLLAPFILIVAAAIQNNYVEDVASQAKNCSGKHNTAIDISWVNQSFNSFREKPYQEAPDD